MKLTRTLLPILVLAAFALAACGEDSDSGTTGGGGEDEAATAPRETTAPGEGATQETAPSGEAVRAATVEIEDFAYQPATVTIQAGGKVIWLNRDTVEHTATLDDGSFSTGDLAEGKMKSQSFKTAGTFAYHCELHPDMTGTVEVVEPG